jgi:hypothetical protein
MNHRKKGVPMFDATTGALLEGIGHYGCERVAGQGVILSTCNTPYPCAFDRGVLTAMARRFAPGAVVQQDDDLPCRHQGMDSCTYRVSW